MSLDLQSYFLKFHDEIKLGTYNEEQTLRDKREILLGELKERLKKTDSNPTFTKFDQGSYAMHTGIIPKDGDFDIDIGLIFDFDKEQNTPVDLKTIVRDNLTKSRRTVDICRSCVTVKYLKGDSVDYHVDLACYAKDSSGSLYLAKGKEFSTGEKIEWELSDPEKIISEVREAFSEPLDRAQMRRVVRYFKKWRDNRLPASKPFSIALTWAARNWFSPYPKPFEDGYDDLEAVYGFTQILLSRFIDKTDGSWLEISLFPVAPCCDLNERMTQLQMNKFKEELESLRDALKKIRDETIEEKACKALRKIFGDEFPVPEKKDTALKSDTAPYAVAGVSA